MTNIAGPKFKHISMVNLGVRVDTDDSYANVYIPIPHTQKICV